MNKKRIAAFALSVAAAGAVLGAATPAHADSGRAIDGIHHAAGSLVGGVHIKVSNYTDYPVQLKDTFGKHITTLNPTETFVDTDGDRATYNTFNNITIETKKGTFKVEGQNAWVGYPWLGVTNMPGKKGEKFSGYMYVGERWGHTHAGTTYAFFRDSDGSSVQSNTKNFHVVLD